MSLSYPNLTETEFPEKVDAMVRMEDFSFSDLALADEYERLYRAGNFSGAKQLLENNPSLNSKIFNAVKFNKLIDAIIATQQFFRDDVETYIDDTKDSLQEYVDAFTYVGEYLSTKQYVKKNVITHFDCSYICLIDCKGIAPVRNQSTAYWGIIARGVKGESGLGLSPRGIWGSSEAYYADDWVCYENRIWQCVNDNIASIPDINNPDWLCVMNYLPLTGVTWGDLAGLNV